MEKKGNVLWHIGLRLKSTIFMRGNSYDRKIGLFNFFKGTIAQEAVNIVADVSVRQSGIFLHKCKRTKSNCISLLYIRK